MNRFWGRLVIALAACAAISAPLPAAATQPSQLLTPYVLFNWAVDAYPALFPYCPPSTYWPNFPCDYDESTGPYVYRRYSKSGNYLGAAGRDLYLLGPASGGAIKYVGNLAQYACYRNSVACTVGTETGAPLFMLDFANGEISTFRQPNPESGKVLVGTSFQLHSALGRNLAYDASNDRLFVPAWGGKVFVVDQASTVSGSVTPSRTIEVAGLSLNSVDALFYDKANDILYASGTRTYDDVIAVFNNASNRNGSVTPDRVLTFGQHFRYFTIDTTRQIGYVAGDFGILTVTNMATVNGTVTAARSFSGAPGSGEIYFIPSAIAIDPARDRLYVAVNGYDGGLHAFDNASTLSGNFLSNTFVQSRNNQFITFDAANDRLYVGAYTDAYVINSASTLTTGPLPASAQKLTGGTGMSIGGFASGSTQ